MFVLVRSRLSLKKQTLTLLPVETDGLRLVLTIVNTALSYTQLYLPSVYSAIPAFYSGGLLI